MRVLLDLRPLQGEDSARGIGATARGLASALPDVGCLLWRRRPVPVEALGRQVRFRTGPARPGRLSWLADGVRSSRPSRDLVHLLAPDPSGGWPATTVVTVNDAIPWRFSDLYPAGPTGRARLALAGAVARRARVVVVPSSASAADAVAYLGVRQERVRIVPWAPDPGLVPPGADEVTAARNRFRLPDRYVLMAGGFAHRDPRKRYGDALAALARLPEDVGLAVTGSPGPAEAAFALQAAESGVGDRVVRTGQVDVQTLAALFGGASVFVFPSRWEGFGLPLLDALALGVPAVISDGGSLPEVAGGAALVHPAGDAEAMAGAVRQVLGDPALAAALAERGRARAAQFSWEKVGAAYRDVYREAGASL